MSFFSIYKFLLAIVICAIAVLGADARHVDKRWIQYTGVGGSDDHYKRAIGDGNGGQAEQSQQDAGIFPKFPGDEDEFEQESQVQGQDDNIPPLDKDKLQEGQDNFGISGNNGFVGEESSSLPPADTESNDIGDEGQSSQNSGFEDVGQQDSYQGGKGSGSWYGKEREEDNEIDVTTERQQHKPWYKKVHGFLKNQYNYIKSRVGRADDYYVNQ